MKVSHKVLVAAILSIAGTNAFAADAITGLATTNYVKGAMESLNVDAKEDVANKVQLGDSENPEISATDLASDDKYPSMKTAQQIAADAAADAVVAITSNVNELFGTVDEHAGQIDGLEGRMDAAESDIDALQSVTAGYTGANAIKTAVDSKVTTAQGTTNKQKVMATNAAGNVVPATISGGGSVSVSVADNGNITISGTDTKYTLPEADGDTLGGVKSGGDMIATSGELTIDNGKVIEAKLATDAVTTVKIKDLNVTEAKLAADAVTNAKLADDAVQTENIANGTILDADISDDAAIAVSKLAKSTAPNKALVDLGAGPVWLDIVDTYPTGN